MRDAIAGLPDGRYNAKTYIDGYEESDDPSRRDLPIEVTAIVDGDVITVDFTGTAAQVSDRPINMPLKGTTDCAVWLTLRSILLDTVVHGHIPQNSGLTRPIKIVAPQSSLVNPTFPAPTIARFCAGNQAADTLMKALGQAVPRQISAGVGNLHVVAFSGIQDAGHWVHMEIHEGCYGGRYGKDGLDAVDTLYANTRNNPIEDIESHLPLRVNRYELRDESCPPGKWRGGIGSIREFEYLEDGGVSVEGEGHVYAPWGFDGGKDGHTSALLFEPNQGNKMPLPSKLPNKAAKAGDKIVMVGPCGGGYGNPFERDSMQVVEDVRDGYLSSEQAQLEYGVVVSASLDLDETATKKLRLERTTP
jgi:N-methylhydantoinase B